MTKLLLGFIVGIAVASSMAQVTGDGSNVVTTKVDCDALNRHILDIYSTMARYCPNYAVRRP